MDRPSPDTSISDSLNKLVAAEIPIFYSGVVHGEQVELISFNKFLPLLTPAPFLGIYISLHAPSPSRLFHLTALAVDFDQCTYRLIQALSLSISPIPAIFRIGLRGEIQYSEKTILASAGRRPGLAEIPSPQCSLHTPPWTAYASQR